MPLSTARSRRAACGQRDFPGLSATERPTSRGLSAGEWVRPFKGARNRPGQVIRSGGAGGRGRGELVTPCGSGVRSAPGPFLEASPARWGYGQSIPSLPALAELKELSCFGQSIPVLWRLAGIKALSRFGQSMSACTAVERAPRVRTERARRTRCGGACACLLLQGRKAQVKGGLQGPAARSDAQCIGSEQNLAIYCLS